MKTLIVEDDKAASKLLQAALEYEGYRTKAVKDHHEALLVLESQKVDCIVSDVTMPNMDGFRMAYKERPSTRFTNIPLIMYDSGATSEDDEQFAMSLGVNKYIRKSGSTKEVVKAVSEIFIPPVKASEEMTQSAPENWAMDKYGKFLLDKLETKIEELEQIKIKLESNERELKELNEHLDLRVEDRTRELQRSLEKEKQLVALKSKVVSIVSHEFKTPLSSINFQVGLVKKHSRNLSWKEVMERMTSVQQQIKHLTELLDDLLTLGQEEACNLKVVSREVHAGAFFKEIVTDIMHSTNNTHTIHSYINIDQNKLMTDGRLLRNIVINLLSNAVKYSPVSKTTNFTVTQENTNLIIEVEDFGIGIHKDELEAIFNSFTRGINVAAIQGTGLGLSIVQKAVEALNGSISVKSRLNEGSVFKVRIPLPHPGPMLPETM